MQLRSSDWACDSCSIPTPLPPTTTPPSDQNSDDCTFNILQLNVLQLNANGIGNKLTELGVVIENNKVKVAVIQESKLTPSTKRMQLACGWCASRGGGLQIVSYPAFREARPPIFVEASRASQQHSWRSVYSLRETLSQIRD